MSNSDGLLSSAIGGIIITGLLTLLGIKKEGYTEYSEYNPRQAKPQSARPSLPIPRPGSSVRQQLGQQANGNGNIISTPNIQQLNQQMYSESLTSAVPTSSQLDRISGLQSNQAGKQPLGQMGGRGEPMAAGDFGSAGVDPLGSSVFQSVNFGSERSQNISSCSPMQSNFVASSLLPKTDPNSQNAWTNTNVNLLANQNYLSAVQQVGMNTTLSSRRNQSYDIRDNIPNPTNLQTPWNNSTILPDLERRPLSCSDTNQPTYTQKFLIDKGKRDLAGLYGCGNPKI